MRLPDEENISIIMKLQPNLPHIVCDSNDITEMLIHLLTNARDAMPDGGKIIISTNYDKKSNEVTISVKDSGTGIPHSIQKKVFDPFFTHKELGKGTGLGLPVIQGIIAATVGGLKLSSTLGKGTTVTLFFPLQPKTDPSINSHKDEEPMGRYTKDTYIFQKRKTLTKTTYPFSNAHILRYNYCTFLRLLKQIAFIYKSRK
jgi:K+-sensing histidine kinase KdpD